MLLHILYLIGITAEAMTGALAAGRRRMDSVRSDGRRMSLLIS